MTADAAHVAAVAEALMNAPAASLGPFLAPIAATVAVETLTPLIRARVAAEIRAEASQVLTDDGAGQIERSALLAAARIIEGSAS